MQKLNRIVAPALVAALGIGVALPAQAHESGRNIHKAAYEYRHHADRRTPYRNTDIRFEIRDLARDIDRAAHRHAISRREAASLRADVRSLERLHLRYARNGLTRWEHRVLDNKVDRLRTALRIDRRDRDRHRG